MFATTDLVPLLAMRGVCLSREQVYRLVTRTPERLSLTTLAALCDILGCGPGDLVEPVAPGGRGRLPGRDLGCAACGPGPAAAGPDPARSRQGRVTVSAPGPARPATRPVRASPAAAVPRCRRDAIVAQVAAADRSLAPGQVAAAVDAAAGNGQALRSLAAALAGRTARDVLADGAPPGVGRLVTELIARGSAEFTAPACKSCGTTGRPLTRSSRGGVCPRCRNRLLAVACARCGEVKPVAGRTDAGEPVCERCRRHERGHRPCGTCGKTAPIAVRARGGRADVCVNCYQMPQAVCTACGRRRPCNFAGGGNPVCKTCTPRAASRLRPLRPGPAGGRALARGPGLRHLLHQRAAPPGRLHGLRSAAAAGRAARPRRDHVRGLRRPAAHPSVRALRRRGQAVRERPLRTLQPARPGLGPAGRRRSRSDPRAHRASPRPSRRPGTPTRP